MPLNERDLEEKIWPQADFPIGKEVIGRGWGQNSYRDDSGLILQAQAGFSCAEKLYPREYLEACYVQTGRVEAVALPIPDEECAISSLIQSDVLYGTTVGRRSHLFAYAGGRVKDLGIIEENCRKSSLAVADNRVYIGTEPMEGEGSLYVYQDNRLVKLVCPVPGEGIVALVADRNRLYGLSNKSGILFIYHTPGGKLELKARIEPLFSPVLALSSAGDVYGGSRWSNLFKYVRADEKVINLDVQVPALKGREMYNKIESLIYYSDYIYGGTSADGWLFRFNLKKERLISLGKPLNQPHIRCMAVAADGALYGMAGKDCCHLFRYAEGDLRDLGILRITSPRFWHGYQFAAAVAGLQGEIYLGEADRISHLFIYYPPILK
ncbi:MAG: hypothetical protein WC074_06690 [bacterium]